MAKSLGSYISLNRNPVNQIRSFVSRTENREDEQRLIENAQLAILSEEDVSFVIINAEQATQSLRVNSDPHRFPLELSPVQLQYLKDKPVAVTSILRKLKDKGFACKFDFEAHKVDIRTLSGHSESEALQMIQDSIVEMDFPAAQMAMMEDMVDFLPTQDSGGMEALVVKVGSMVKLVGMADDMTQFGGSLRASMEQLDVGVAAPLQQTPAEATKEEVIPMTENCFNYLCRYKWTELTTLVKQFPNVNLEHGRNNVKVNGLTTAVDEAVELVRTEMEKVKIFEIKLGPQINVAVIAQVVQEIGQKYDCIITYQQNFGAMGGAPVAMPPVDPQLQSMSLSIALLKEVRVRVVMGALERQEAHVIVNTTNSKLELSQGKGLSHCILQAAGPSIQTDVRQKYPNGVKNGEVAESGPGNMNTCRTIYHGCLPAFPQNKSSPDYQKQQEKCLKWMVSLVFNCLIKASSSEVGYRTIALPALGTGYLEYPAQHVVQLMYKAVKLFKGDKRSGQIKDIIIVIYPDTKLEVKQIFLAYRQTYRLDTRHVASLADIHEENRKEKKKTCEFRVSIGQTLLQVVNGNLRDACDVYVSEAVLVLWTEDEILNPETNPGLLCMDPDKPIWDSCSPYVAELPETMCALDTTTLPQRTLIHCYCPDEHEKSLKDALVQGLKNAAQFNCNSATIPIAARGNLSKKPRASTQMIINAIKKAKTNLLVVTVAIEDNGIFLNVATKVAKDFNNKFQEPADIDKLPYAVDLWKRTYADKAAESQSSLQKMITLTNSASVLVITSDSDSKNKMAADEIEAKLNIKLPAVLQIQQTM